MINQLQRFFILLFKSSEIKKIILDLLFLKSLCHIVLKISPKCIFLTQSIKDFHLCLKLFVMEEF